MPMSLMCQPISTKDIYRLYKEVKQRDEQRLIRTEFSQLASTLQATNSFSVWMNFWLFRLHSDQLAGEFNENDLQRHLPPLRNALDSLKNRIDNSQESSENWWRNDDNVQAFNTLMKTLQNISGSRTCSGYLRNIGWQLLDSCLDFLYFGLIAGILGSLIVTGLGLVLGAASASLFVTLFPSFFLLSGSIGASMSAGFNLFFSNSHDRNITKASINGQIRQQRLV